MRVPVREVLEEVEAAARDHRQAAAALQMLHRGNL